MKIKRYTINSDYIETIDWLEGKIVDWVNAGKMYHVDGRQEQIAYYNFSFDFDGSITSPNGEYVLVYKRLSTKGLLLKNGQLIREVNRSYYHADTYEYPAAFMVFENRTYLVHCPREYCRLDFEDAETGVIITDVGGRKPADIFHSRLSVSPDGRYLMSCAWLWHPVEAVEIFDIKECFDNLAILDNGGLRADFDMEINSASFIDNDHILLSSSDGEPFDDNPRLPEKHIAIWNFKKDELSTPVAVKAEFGNLFAINEKYAWDLYKYPKIINIHTGEIEDKLQDINSGIQNSSIYRSTDNHPQIRFDRESGKIAIKISNKVVEVLSAD